MSLGFLTESALLPSKAKQIKVDSKSILDLKAVVFQKEQERKERRRRLAEEIGDDDSGANNGFGSSSRQRRQRAESGDDEDGMKKSIYARVKATNKRRKREQQQEKNHGVDNRSRRDEAERELDVHNDDDEEALQLKSREMLKRKAELYDQLMQGKRDGVPSAAVKECLVDFAGKRRATGGGGAAAADDVDVVAVVAETEYESERVQIVDEFGRTRSVLRGSAEFVEHARSQQREDLLFFEDKRREPEKNGDDDVMAVQQGSFVVSQWEKTLNRADKHHLEQVHAGTEHAKLSMASMDRTPTRKQLRLEKLRQQQQQTAATSSTATASPMDRVTPENAAQDQDAATKATAFLNQFM